MGLVCTKMTVVSSSVVGAMEDVKKNYNKNAMVFFLTSPHKNYQSGGNVSYTNADSQVSRCFKRTSKIHLIQIAVANEKICRATSKEDKTEMYRAVCPK